MWFNNALIYQCQLDNTEPLTDLLAENALKPCPPHARFIYGWLPVLQHEFVHQVSGATLLKLGKEERLLPRGVIKRLLTDQIAQLEAQRGYPVKRAEKSQLAEELEFQLLPKAFCLEKSWPALFDEVSQRLIINTTSNTQAGQLLALLRKSVPGISIEPVHCEHELTTHFTHWVVNPDALPAPFTLSSTCVLSDLQQEAKRLQCKGYELPSDEISSLIQHGLTVTELSLIWNERIAFTLTHDFILKRVTCLDYLVDEFHDIHGLDDERMQQDAALALLSGEWRQLINDLLKACNAPPLLP
jgi:recombination associated protein RdgC